MKRTVAGHVAQSTVKPMWSLARLCVLVHDERLLGYVNPHKGGHDQVNGWEDTGIRAKIFPQVIEQQLFDRVQEVTKKREFTNVGVNGGFISNLFPGKAVCKSCGDTMWSKGGVIAGRRHASLQCSSYHQGRGCQDKTAYALRWYEPRILQAIAHLSNLVPESRSEKIAALMEEQAATKAAIKQKRAMANSLEHSKTDLAAVAERIIRLEQEAAQLSAKVRKGEAELNALGAPRMRMEEIARFVKTFLAKQHDRKAREEMRGMLSATDFKLVGDPDGGMLVIVGDREDHIPAGREWDHARIVIPKGEKLGKGATEIIDGKKWWHVRCGWWTDGKRKMRRSNISSVGQRLIDGERLVVGKVYLIDGRRMQYVGKNGWWLDAEDEPD